MKTHSIIKTKTGAYFETTEDQICPPFKAPFIKCWPVGGGFEQHIPRRDIAEYDAKLPANIQLLTVGFWEKPICQAYCDLNQRWNGWLCPRVDRANLEKFLGVIATVPGAAKFAWDGNTLVVTYPDGYDCAPDLIEPFTLKVGGTYVKVWDISLGYVWTEIESEWAVGKRISYDDGRPLHRGVQATILNVDDTGMTVQFDDRAQSTRISFSDREWMESIKLIN